MNKKFLTTACAAMLGVTVAFTGCGSLNPDAALVKINTGDSTDTISLGYGNFAARYQQAIYDQYLMAYYGETMWTSDMSGSGSTLQDDTKDGVLEDMEEFYLCKLHADEYGVSLTDEDNAAIDAAVAEFFETNPEETMDVMGATEEYVKEYLEYRTYYTRVSEAVKEAADISVSDDECWMKTFSYVRFDTTANTDDDGNPVELTDDELADLKADAQGLADADDFDAYLENSDYVASTYSFLKGEEEDDSFDMSIISTAEEMEVGDVSSVIEVEGDGYYVIRLDSDHDEEASESERETLISQGQQDAYDEVLEGWKAAISWEVDDKQWEKVQFTTLFSTLETEDDSTDDTSADDTTETSTDAEDTDAEDSTSDTEEESEE